MYHLSTSRFQNNEGINDCADKGCIQKTTKKHREIKKISTLASPKNSLKNAMKVGIYLL